MTIVNLVTQYRYNGCEANKNGGKMGWGRRNKKSRFRGYFEGFSPFSPVVSLTTIVNGEQKSPYIATLLGII
jgi:hypothetical protein